MPNTADLLEGIAALKAMLIAADARDLRKDERIERLEKLIAAFKHAAFGRRSEKSDLLPGNRLRANDERAEQLELALEDLETPSPQSIRRKTAKIASVSAPSSHGLPIEERCPNICRVLKR